MTKPTVFIGSSVEHKRLAETVQLLLDYDVIPIPWTQGTFEPTKSPLESLESTLETVDFAVLVCAPEERDHSVIRGQERKVVRDNIIFELGLFIGRLGRDRTFLISPRDVDLHLPSDLAGIFPESYDVGLLGSNPEAALGPACGKIKRAISKLGALPRPEPVQAKGEKQPSEEQPTSNDDDGLQPSDEWTFSTYRWKYVLALVLKNDTAAKTIDQAFGKSSFAASPQDVAYWEAWRQHAKIMAGGSGDVAAMRAKCQEFPNDPRLKDLLARTLVHYGDKEEAEVLFSEALRNAVDWEFAQAVVHRALEIDQPSSIEHRALSYLEKLNSLPRNNYAEELNYLRALNRVAESAGFGEVAKSIMELILMRQPEDTSSRFRLAYDYSEANQAELSMLHYQAIPESERSGTAWNNLGVAFSRLHLKGMAVTAYKMGSDRGETIADGNLAQMLQGAGFFDEAQQRAEAAIAKADHDQSVVKALNSLGDARAAEQSAVSKLIAEAEGRQRMRREIGLAAIAFSGPEITGSWETPDGLMELKSDGGTGYLGELRLEREVPRYGLLFGTTMARETVVITVKLRRFGAALEGTIYRETPGNPTTILGFISAEKTVLLSVSQDGTEITGFECDHGENAITWSRRREIKEISSPLS